jgi:hypothetical protein
LPKNIKRISIGSTVIQKNGTNNLLKEFTKLCKKLNLLFNNNDNKIEKLNNELKKIDIRLNKLHIDIQKKCPEYLKNLIEKTIIRLNKEKDICKNKIEELK